MRRLRHILDSSRIIEGTFPKSLRPTSVLAFFNRLKRLIGPFFLPLLILTIVYLGITLFSFEDFGITWDEPFFYNRGRAIVAYLEKRITLEEYNYRITVPRQWYNPLYPALLTLLNPQSRYEIFHLLNCLFAFPLFVAVYLAHFNICRRYWLALLAPIFLLLTPGFAGHIPANVYDVPFATMYFVTLVGIYISVRQLDIRLKIIVLGILIGLTLTLRILGLTLIVLWAFFEIYNYHAQNKAQKLKSFVFNLAIEAIIILLIASFVVIQTLPYLGMNFLGRLGDIINAGRAFPNEDKSVLFMGSELTASTLPPYYIPFWLGISLPIFILVFFAGGFIFWKKLVTNNLAILLLSAALLNFILYIVLRPTIYNAYRHYLFLIPLITTLAAVTLTFLIERFRTPLVRLVILAPIMLNIVLVAISVINLHPYEYIYFNEVVGGLKGASTSFDTEYWGASYKNAIEWLKENEINPARTYLINTCQPVISSTYYFAENMQWTSDIESADYFVCSTRHNWHLRSKKGEVIFVVSRDGVPLNFVRKMRSQRYK